MQTHPVSVPAAGAYQAACRRLAATRLPLLLTLPLTFTALPLGVRGQDATATPAPPPSAALPLETGGRGQSFLPDEHFTGSSLEQWTMLGDATWQAADGVIRATAKDGGKGGSLLFPRAYQDTALRAEFRCGADTEIGFLFRTERTAEGQNQSRKAVLVSIHKGEVHSFALTLDEEGRERSREELRAAGSIVRAAPPADPNAKPGGGGGGRRPGNRQPSSLPLQRPDTSFRADEWNQIEIFLDLNLVRSFLNDSGETAGGAVDDGTGRFGPPGLFVAGTGTAEFRAVAFKDLALRHTPVEESSPRYRVQRISDMYYSWGVGAGDFNRDGVTDLAAGPYVYFGPDFTRYREIYPGFPFNPSKEFTDVNCQYSHDFNGDGWPDILTGPPRATVYLNPGTESRRWDKFEVLTSVQTEITVFADLDGSGVPALVYGSEGTLRYAKPDAADPRKPWVQHIISQAGVSMAHGIGVGDLNGDGRPDILNPQGWWEQPAPRSDTEGTAATPWTYHPQAFARFGHRSSGAGGAVMTVYDVNGDGLNDVVTSLNAHGFGLGWYEQRRDPAGAIRFEPHLIADDFSRENPGGVTFSQVHGTAAADIDGDGIPDFIAGKRYWSHLDNYFDPDPYGAPVLYVYRTVRNPAAPGGAEFVPELVHNRSGAGSDVLARDLDGDGDIDLATSTDRGTFIFWNTTRKGPGQ